ncbi:MAG: DUF1570 domain-containing protein [Gemmataceae bacterium]|nr:DUF1570 domain-containing protein [Gemmataceae bacterium]MDW8267289.1 DUF1570 domain-containing protein [Gemmataceae bacterium]
MKRSLVVLTLALGVVWCEAQADYYGIRVNLGGTQGLEPAPAVPKGMPLPPQPVTNPNASGPKGIVNLPPLYAAAVVEIKRPPQRGTGNVYFIEHKWGRTILYQDQKFVLKDFLRLPTAYQEMEEKQKELLADKSAEKRLEVAEWALGRGLLNEFVTHMDELVKTPSDNARIKAVAQSYAQVKEALQAAKPKDDALISHWKDRLNLRDPFLTNHYTVLYDSSVTNPPEVARYAARLERCLQGFYYWFALRGVVLPVPSKRLVAILVDKPDDFRKWHAVFDSVPMVGDGFFTRRDNLLIFSTVRLDEVYQTLSRSNQQELWSQGWSFTDLLGGRSREGSPKSATPDLIARASSLALLQRAMLEESERLTVSHEATRQLVAAAGLLPRGVAAPEWIQFGLASVFETPRTALWDGVGIPHWEYLLEYKLRKADEPADEPKVALQRTITDYYFYQAARSGTPEDVTRARTQAWALAYFLAQRHLGELLRYYQELATLPRDLEMDDETLLGCFARAFQLENPARPGTIDGDKLGRLAAEWHQYISNVAPPIPQPRLMEMRDFRRGVLPSK